MPEVETYPIVSKVTLDLDGWSQGVTQVGGDAKKLGAEIDNRISIGIASLEKKLADEIKQVSASMTAVQEVSEKTHASIEGVGDAIAGKLGQESADSAGVLTDAVNQLSESFSENQDAAEQLNRSIFDVEDGWNDAKRAAEELDRAVAKAAEDSFRELDASVARMRDSVGGMGEQAKVESKWLREAFGPGGGFAAINKIAGDFARVGEAAGEASIGFRTGQMSIAGATGGALRGVPVLGNFIRGWDGLKEAVTGTGAALQIAEREIARTTQRTEALLGMLESVKSFRASIDAEGRKDVDDDLVQRADAAKSKIEADRKQRKQSLLDELDAADGIGDRAGKDRILGDIHRLEEVARAESKKIDAELSRGLALRQQRRAQEQQAEREFDDPLGGRRAAGFRDAIANANAEAGRLANEAARATSARMDRERQDADREKQQLERAQRNAEQTYLKNAFDGLQNRARQRAGEIDDRIGEIRSAGGSRDLIADLQGEKRRLSAGLEQAKFELTLDVDADKVANAVSPMFRRMIDEKLLDMESRLLAADRNRGAARAR